MEDQEQLRLAFEFEKAKAQASKSKGSKVRQVQTTPAPQMDPIDVSPPEQGAFDSAMTQVMGGVGGAASYLSRGLMDEAAGVARGVGSLFPNSEPGWRDPDQYEAPKERIGFMSNYRAGRDDMQRTLAESEAETPMASKIGKGAAFAAELPFAMNPAKLALDAGVRGAGESQADLTRGEVGEFAKDVGVNTALGYGAGKVGEGLGRLGSVFKNGAQDAALAGQANKWLQAGAAPSNPQQDLLKTAMKLGVGGTGVYLIDRTLDAVGVDPATRAKFYGIVAGAKGLKAGAQYLKANGVPPQIRQKALQSLGQLSQGASKMSAQGARLHSVFRAPDSVPPEELEGTNEQPPE